MTNLYCIIDCLSVDEAANSQVHHLNASIDEYVSGHDMITMVLLLNLRRQYFGVTFY